MCSCPCFPPSPYFSFSRYFPMPMFARFYYSRQHCIEIIQVPRINSLRLSMFLSYFLLRLLSSPFSNPFSPKYVCVCVCVCVCALYGLSCISVQSPYLQWTIDRTFARLDSIRFFRCIDELSPTFNVSQIAEDNMSKI